MSVIFLPEIVLFQRHFWTYPNNNNFPSSKMRGKKTTRITFLALNCKGHNSDELLGYRKVSFSL
jgi:hypothetical protein